VAEVPPGRATARAPVAPGSPARATAFYPALHALRGLAAIWVMLFHVWYFSGERQMAFGVDALFRHGWVGVHLFYALSAFLLSSHLLARRKPRYGAFFLRRFLRIYPAYWAQLAVLVPAAGVFALNAEVALLYWPEHLLMIFNLPPRFVTPLNGVWWTLPIEFLFYLLLPALLWCLRRIGMAAFLALAIAATVFYRGFLFHYLGEAPVALVEQLPGVLSVFAAGMVAAAVLARRPLRWPRWAAPAALGAMALWAWPLLADPEGYWNGSPLLFAWGSVNALLIAILLLAIHDRGRNTNGWRLLVWLGEISYGIYLWHLPVILGLVQLAPALGSDFTALLAAAALPTTALAWLSLSLVEKPAIRLGRRLSRRHRPGTEAAAG